MASERPLHDSIDMEAYDVVPRADYDRLREALEEITNPENDSSELRRIARRALARPENERG